MSALARKYDRHPAVDFFRGLGLWVIFLDHMNHNVLARFTPWRLGFSDFAEAFIFLSGYAGIATYQRALAHADWQKMWRIFSRRAARLYLAHVLALLAALALIGLCAAGGLRLASTDFYLWTFHPLRYLFAIFTIQYAPAIFKLLPLYLWLCPVLPLAAWGLRRAPRATLTASFAIWTGAQYAGSLGAPTEGWFFDPFAWQFVLVLGGAVHLFQSHLLNFVDALWLRMSSLVVVSLSFALKALVLFPAALARLPVQVAATLPINAGKAELAPYRLLHFAAVVVLASWLLSRRPGLLQTAPSRLAIACGRDSLVLYSVSLLLDVASNLALTALHGQAPLQIALSLVGILILCALAYARSGLLRSEIRTSRTTRASSTSAALTSFPPASTTP